MDNKRNLNEFKSVKEFYEYKKKEIENKYNQYLNGYFTEVLDNGKVVHHAPLVNAPGPNVRDSEPPKNDDYIDIFTMQNDSEKVSRLHRLYSNEGIVYRFNRGIVLIGKDGKRIEDIFDRTTKHHANRLFEIARDDFGVTVNFNGTASDIFCGIEAGDNGLISILYEGNNAMIFIPEELSIEQIDVILDEINPRKNFIFSVARTFDKYAENLTYEDVFQYFNGLKKEKVRIKQQEEEKQKENIKMSKEEYIYSLDKFLKENNINLNDYCNGIALMYRNNQSENIPDFEKQNPFVTKNDINILINSKNKNITQYYADAMAKVINLNLSKMVEKSTSKQKENNKNNKKMQDIKYIITVLNYIKENNMTISDYYKKIAFIYRNNQKNIPEFEKNNPFITENDIKLLSKSDNERIGYYFSETMTKIIKSYIKEAKEYNNSNKHKQKNDSKQKNKNSTNNINSNAIPFEICDDLDGYAVIKNENDIDIYTYSANEKSILRNRVTYSSSIYNLEAGYYVSIDDFLNEIRKYTTTKGTVLVDENEHEVSIDEVKNALRNICIKRGGIRQMNHEGKKNNNYYINRNHLRNYLKKYKIKNIEKVKSY